MHGACQTRHLIRIAKKPTTVTNVNDPNSKEAKRSDVGTSLSKPPDDPRLRKKDEHGIVFEETDSKALLDEKQKYQGCPSGTAFALTSSNGCRAEKPVEGDRDEHHS
jgi:hypothetical protein